MRPRKDGAGRCVCDTYAGNDLLYALLVALHLHERLDLRHGQILAVSLRHELVESAQQIKGVLGDLALVQ